MAKPGRTGLSRVIHASRYSWQGLCAAWQHEAAFRQELMLVGLLMPVSFWLADSLLVLLLLWIPLFMVLIAELINSALEAVVDRISDEHHELSGRAKDIGSAAVFLALTLTALVWGGVAWHRFVALS